MEELVIGGGGHQGSGSSTVVSQPAPAQIAPQFAPYASQVGQAASQALSAMPITPFGQPMPLQVPGLSPLQQQAVDLLAQQTQFGIPTPAAQQALFTPATATTPAQGLVPFAQQIAQTPVGPQFPELQALGQYGGVPLDTTASGIQALQRFASGDLANSPAIQSAVEQISQQVIPRTENEMVKAGLGRSPALGEQLAENITATLQPLFQQGLQQQQSAAQQLIGTGLQTAGAQQQLGGTFGQRASDTITRALGAAQAAYAPLTTIGQSEQDRTTQQINQALQGGALLRDIQAQVAQAIQDDQLRRQALSEEFSTAMLGQIPSFTSFPSTTEQITRQPVSK